METAIKMIKPIFEDDEKIKKEIIGRVSDLCSHFPLHKGVFDSEPPKE